MVRRCFGPIEKWLAFRHLVYVFYENHTLRHVCPNVIYLFLTGGDMLQKNNGSQ